MNKDLIISISIMLICVLVVVFSSISIYKKVKNKPEEKQTPDATNTYEIKDESLGITFLMDKDFVRLDQKDLQAKNPFFVYGFRPKDVTDAGCFVSQTKRSNSGKVTPEYLKDGTFNEIKKSSPDAVIDNWSTVNLGIVDGAKMTMKFKESDKNMIQIEVVGATEKSATFAFCSSPESLYNDLYKNKFETFLNSIELK